MDVLLIMILALPLFFLVQFLIYGTLSIFTTSKKPIRTKEQVAMDQKLEEERYQRLQEKKTFLMHKGIDIFNLNKWDIERKYDDLIEQERRARINTAARKRDELRRTFSDLWERLEHNPNDFFEISLSFKGETYRGVYAIRFYPSGKFYVDFSLDILSKIKRDFEALSMGDHSCEKLQDAYMEGFREYRVFVIDSYDNPPHELSGIDLRESMLKSKERFVRHYDPPLNDFISRL